ncbi:outer membrane protein [Legionella birminghamensis]|uniref:Translocation and assembly module subunit TamA n=2 Tax=Legionella birminghamensis TaxID=28083 RepID=A0A378I7G9_9GAMM|nr:POTRA domain-containing protein [Legionella birminghamensis]KTC68171.1 outer membrane protein [Legionella birminghamensis]STX31119.1 outer membrane protein [Legionella birminghamensis]
MAAETTGHFVISGVKGKVLANVQSRLQEIAENKPLESQTDEELKAQVAQALSPYGYFNSQASITRGRNNIQIKITPGPRLLIAQVSISIVGEGNDNYLIKRALNKLTLKPGKPFISQDYEQAKQTLMNAAENQGYLHASFDKAEVLVDSGHNSASIQLVFNTGPQFFFGQVQFSPSYISPELLRRYIPFAEGQSYSTEQILAFNNALSSSGYFSNVIVKPVLNEEGQMIPVNVHLQPAPRTNYSIGLGFGTDTGVRGRLGYHVVPVNSAGHKFNAIALGSMNENRLQAQYIIPGQNPLTDQYDIFGSLANLNYSAGYSNSAQVSLAQRHTLNHYQRVLSLNGLYERYSYDETPKFEKLILYPKASLSWMNKKDQLFSPTGYNVTVNALGASKLALSEVNFAQASVDAKAAVTLEKMRTRLYLHTIQGVTLIDDINQLPLSLSMLLGGADNLKAYTYNSIGPGKIMSYGGIEIQKETLDNWYVTAFFDTGDVYKPSLKDWQNDLGIGLMWVSPIGPIKVGVAQAIDSGFNRKDKKPRLVINMGPDL